MHTIKRSQLVSRGLGIALSVVILLGVQGWSPARAQDTKCPGAPLPQLTIGQPALVPPGTPNNLREAPTRSATILAQIPGDTIINVLDGPTCADSINWWQISSATLTGWMAEGAGAEYYMVPIATGKATLIVKTPTFPIAYQNVRLLYTGVAGTRIQIETIPATWDATTMSPWVNAGYTQFVFSGLDWMWDNRPSILIFAAADIKRILKEENDPQGEINLLQDILTTQPQTLRLPLPLAYDGVAQTIAAVVGYPKSEHGLGVRFVANYTQNYVPILAKDLIYTYQGLTSDGRFYIRVEFPVHSNVLAKTRDEDEDFSKIDMGKAEDAAQWNTYYDKITAKLNAAAPNTFSPPLSMLDALVQSIIVH